MPELPSGFPVAPPGGVVGDEARAHGEVHVSSRVVGFKKIKFYTNENVGSGDLDLPEQQMHTTAYWLTVPQPVMAALPVSRPTIGATAWWACRSRCARWRSCC